MKRTSNDIKTLLQNELFINRKRLSKSSDDEMLVEDNGNESEIEYIDSLGKKEQDSLYIFKKDGKYILCSSNDSTRLILGIFDFYPVEGEEDVTNFPINIKNHISKFIEEVEYVNEHGDIEENDTVEGSGSIIDETTNIRSNWKTISPLITTLWGQGAPYSNDLPYDTVNLNSNNTQSNCVTGCTCTALSQVIAYWGRVGINGVKYKIGCGKTTAYTSTKNGFSTSIPSLAALSQFDYDNMIDKYSYYYAENGYGGTYKSVSVGTTAQKKAVSQLMQYVGYAIRQNYSYKATSGNVTNVRTYAKSLLSFNNSLSTLNIITTAKSYNTDVFEMKIYNELLNKRPVMIDGSGPKGGHYFICDGYDKSKDLFHINWGWNGSWNGYFAISSLIMIKNDDTVYYDFSEQNSIIINFYPQKFIEDVVSGDFNGDGTVDINDILFLEDSITNNISIPEYDVNGDGYVDIKDVQAIREKINGKNTKKKFSMSINNDKLFGDEDSDVDDSYEYSNINIDKVNRQIKIIKKTKRGANYEPEENIMAISLPTISNFKDSINTLMNSQTSSIKSIYTTYLNNRSSLETSKNALQYLNTYKDNLITSDRNFVDLGLSVEWATMNLGASKPEDIGNYYCWGELQPNTTYSWSTYPYGDESGCTDIGTNIAKNQDYDAANYYDETICMPTETEFKELINKCIWTKKTINNISIWEVQGPNGNVIYLPITGCKYDGALNSATKGYYWTSTYNSSGTIYATGASIDTAPAISKFRRRTGCAIRPIKVKGSIFKLVDLGLSVKWGNMNLGANHIYDYGKYYAWGETTSRTSFYFGGTNYKYYTAAQNQSKDLGASISKNANYDAAYASNSNLYMPTKTQWQELLDNCTITETTLNSVKGYQIKGPNNNTIFIPLCGYSADGKKYYEGTYGYYLSGTIYSSNVNQYYTTCFFKSGTATKLTYVKKYFGNPLRPVSDTTGTGLVDLGLPSGTKWANKNFGASAAEEIGNLYAWGEISTKDKYTWNNYTHYILIPAVWQNIGSNIAKTQYDAAYTLNKNTCMPTKAQWQELINNCTWRKKLVSNKYLIWEVTGPNGNSIILPINGYLVYWTVCREYRAFYWTSEYNSSDVSKAYFFRSDVDQLEILTDDKSFGVLIRPVSIN